MSITASTEELIIGGSRGYAKFLERELLVIERSLS